MSLGTQLGLSPEAPRDSVLFAAVCSVLFALALAGVVGSFVVAVRLAAVLLP